MTGLSFESRFSPLSSIFHEGSNNIKISRYANTLVTSSWYHIQTKKAEDAEMTFIQRFSFEPDDT